MPAIVFGPVLLSQRTAIADTDTGGLLHDRLAEMGAQVLSDGLGLLRAGLKPVAQPQPEAGVTYAHKLDKAEARLDWSQDAAALRRSIRACRSTEFLLSTSDIFDHFCHSPEI